MLKKRLIGVVLVKAGIAVQSLGFQRYLPLGKPEIAIHYFDRYGIDEIMVLHIDGTRQGSAPTSEQIQRYAKHCQVPLSVGGGIQSLDDIKHIIRSGADKVVFNTQFMQQPELISAAADIFGEQSIIISIDGARTSAGDFVCYDYQTQRILQTSLLALAGAAEQAGAGELLLTSVEQDGSQQGLALEMTKTVTAALSIPVIACGGVGHASHIVAGFTAGAAAVAVGNCLHFTEHSVAILKQYLHRNASQTVRMDSPMTYEPFSLANDLGRPDKLSDSYLDALRFTYIHEEII